MKILMTAALLASPIAAMAQTAPAPKPTIDSSIEAIAANPQGKAILDANFPGMMSHESYPMFKGMTLKQVQPYSGGRITDAQITKVAAELAKLK